MVKLSYETKYLKEVNMDGKITISMITDSSQDEETVRISLVDVKSKTQFVVVEMSLKDFSLAMLGRGRVDCALNFNNIQNVSKQQETKMFSIQADEVGRLSRLKLDEMFIEGWRVDPLSYKNSNNYTLNPPDAAYKFTANVLFERFV